MRKSALSAIAFAAFASQALAADLPALKEAPPPVLAPAPSDWRFEATINGWGPSLISNLGVGRFPMASADASIFQLLRHLKGIAPLGFVARNDNFITGLDLFWVRLSAGSTFTGPQGAGSLGGLNANMTLNETILTGFAGVRIPVESPELRLYAIAGARYFNLNATLDLDTAVPGFDRSQSRVRNWVDPIGGLALRYKINDKWYVDAEADGGGYNNSATVHGLAAVGYNLTQSISTTVGLRALYVNYQQSNNRNGSFRFQETLVGPQATISYNF